jgi:molybdopterin converting factor subunit 1
LFARLRELTGASELSRAVTDGSTAGDVWQALVREFPALAEYTHNISVAVNEEYAKASSAVREGDEVAFLPPVSGG